MKNGKNHKNAKEMGIYTAFRGWYPFFGYFPEILRWGLILWSTSIFAENRKGYFWGVLFLIFCFLRV